MKKTKEELYKWFFNKFESCYVVEHEDNKGNFYMYYDEQFIRQKKMVRILDSDEEIVYPSKPSGKVLFEQDWKNENLWCDYDEIWSYLETNYSSNYDEIRELITWMLKEHEKLSVLTPSIAHSNVSFGLKEHEKLSVLTPIGVSLTFPGLLKEHEKLSVLTPNSGIISISILLKEHEKLSVLTPLGIEFKKIYLLKEHDNLSVLTPLSQFLC